jgi:galactoside O-acetyltransferase
MTIREKMKAGHLYTDLGEGLKERERCKELTYDYNLTRPREAERRRDLLKQLLGSCGNSIWIEPPVHMAYGRHVHIGDGFYANFNLVLVDDVDIYIGNNVMIAPNVTISLTGHLVHPDLRRGGTQFSVPVRIGDDVWIGSNVVILPGVTIGNNSVVGAGSVVTRDIPENVVAVGNPCRVSRPIDERDKEYYYRDRKVLPSLSKRTKVCRPFSHLHKNTPPAIANRN